jgi:hypothetical protein
VCAAIASLGRHASTQTSTAGRESVYQDLAASLEWTRDVAHLAGLLENGADPDGLCPSDDKDGGEDLLSLAVALGAASPGNSRDSVVFATTNLLLAHGATPRSGAAKDCSWQPFERVFDGSTPVPLSRALLALYIAHGIEVSERDCLGLHVSHIRRHARDIEGGALLDQLLRVGVGVRELRGEQIELAIASAARDGRADVVSRLLEVSESSGDDAERSQPLDLRLATQLALHGANRSRTQRQQIGRFEATSSVVPLPRSWDADFAAGVQRYSEVVALLRDSAARDVGR